MKIPKMFDPVLIDCMGMKIRVSNLIVMVYDAVSTLTPTRERKP